MVSKKCTFQVFKEVTTGEKVYIVGNQEELGGWNHNKAVELTECEL